MGWELYITAGKGRGRSFEVPEEGEDGVLELGRASFCAITIRDMQASRRHCQFINEQGRLYVEDLDSTNGTRVNQRLIEDKTLLSDHDEVTVGSHVLTVRRTGEKEEPEGPDRREQREQKEWELLELEGNTFGALEVREMLYEGPASVIYRAHHPKSDRTCALRLVREDKGLSVEHKNRYIRGARYAGQTQHDNLISVYRGGKHRGVFYVLTELVAGRNLVDIMESRDEPMELAEALRITSQVLAAVQAVHESGHVHRNTKPDNVLVTEDGTTKLTDFELVKPLPEGGGESAMTRVLQARVKIDARFSAPELVVHPVGADQRTDLFGAGACLYYMLTNTVPFGAQIPEREMSRALRRRYPPPREKNENIPSAVVNIITTAMAGHPQDRYREPADMKQEVESQLPEHLLHLLLT